MADLKGNAKLESSAHVTRQFFIAKASTPAQVQTIADKLNELITTLWR